MKQKQTYEEWFAEVKRIAKERLGWSEKAIATIDVVAWKEYYDDGFSPIDAWYEEYAAAQ